MNKYYGFIYITTNNINGKKYIGKRKYDKNDKWKSYLGSGVHIKNAIKKYGKENFSKEIIENCKNKEELNNKEIYWINHYNATNDNKFYNIAIGGDGGNVIDGFSEKRINELRLLHSEKSKEYIPKGYNGWTSKITKEQFDKILLMLFDYKTDSEIAKEIGVSLSAIKDIRHHRTWNYFTNNMDFPKRLNLGKLNTNKSKPIVQYSKDLEFIAEYPSARECERITKIGHKMISRVCKGERPYTHGYIFKFK